MHKAKDELIVPQGLRVRHLAQEEFDNLMSKDAGRQYENYGRIAHQLVGTDVSAAQVEKEAERRQRDKMEKLLEEVAKVLPRLAGVDDEEESAERHGVGYKQVPHQPMEADVINSILQGDHGARIATAVVKVAEKVEANVRKVVTAAATPVSSESALPGLCQVK